MMKRFVNVFAICALALVVSGCSTITKSWRSLIGGKEPVDPISRVTTPRFSEQENIRVADNDKQYRRMNRQRFEEEADVKEDAGSLWVMEGQGAYLFSQNQMRMVGDLLNVRVEGSPKAQLQTKVKVISKLLDRLEAPRGLASVKARKKAAVDRTRLLSKGRTHKRNKMLNRIKMLKPTHRVAKVQQDKLRRRAILMIRPLRFSKFQLASWNSSKTEVTAYAECSRS